MTNVYRPAAQRGAPEGVQGAADPNFAACAVRAFAATFPHPRFGGGALARSTWTANPSSTSGPDGRTGGSCTGPGHRHGVPATKGVAATVIIASPTGNLIDYTPRSPVLDRGFGANSRPTSPCVRCCGTGPAGASQGCASPSCWDRRLMEERIAAARVSGSAGNPRITRSPTAGSSRVWPERSPPAGDAQLIREEVADR